jgi:hypothetical protein
MINFKLRKASRLTIIKFFFCYIIFIVLSISNAHSQYEIYLKKDDIIEAIKLENITSILVKDYNLYTYDLKLIGDSMYFNSDIYVDSLGKTELDFVNAFNTPNGYIFAINIKDIQVINYSKFESKKYYNKLEKHVQRARRNFYGSIGLVVAGGVLLIPGLVIPGTIIISVGVLNHLKYIYNRKITFRTEEYNLSHEWIFLK